MSVTSQALSSITVSCFGEDNINIEEALDKAFTNIQEDINYCHCSTRELVMDLSRDEDFNELLKKRYEIEDYISNLNNLFKELNSIIKQVVKPLTPEEKTHYKEETLNRKNLKIMEKNQKKE